MAKPRRNDITKEKLLELKNQGLTTMEIAERLNCSRKTVTDRMAEFGLSRKYLKRKEGTKLLEMAKIYSAEDIAKICRCDVRTVYYWLKMMGVKARSKSETEPVIEKPKKKVEDPMRWKKEILRMYGVWPSSDDKPGTKGIDCRNGKHCRKCFYSGGNTCNYLIIAHEKRGCSPWNCTKYKKGTYKDKMDDKSRYY